MDQGPPRRLAALAIAVLVAGGLLVAGGQITVHGAHAAHGDYRAQVAAFLDGHLALSRAPEAVQHDLAWVNGGVQQVWGLGAPAWQTPFEALGRVLGITPFPDRVALLAWLALAIYLSIRAWVRPGEPWWRGAGAVAITALLPAFVTLLRGRLGVYEEAAAYAYGGAIMLLAGCAVFARDPSRRRYFALCAAAGLTGFFRPTLWCYGLATFVVASLLRRRVREVVVGAALFAAGGAALYASNAARFGDGFEFGHHINLQALPGNLYATRFSYPFERASLVDASAELGGALFGSPERHPRTTFYGKHLHVGQSSLPRWREYYFSTFDWFYVPILAAGLVLGVLAWRRRAAPGDPDARWLVAWAAIAAVPLVAFYLRAPFFASRYALDLAPAFAALAVIAWRAVPARAAAAGVLAALWGVNVATARVAPRIAPTTVDGSAAAETRDAIARAVAYPHPLPGNYDLADPWLPAYTDVLESFTRCTNASGIAIDPDSMPVPGDTCLHGERAPDAEQWTLWQTEVGDDAPPPVCEAEEPACRAEPTAATAGELVDVIVPPPCLYLNMVRWDLATGQVPPATFAWLDDPEFVELDVSTLDGAPADWAHDIQVAIGRTHLRVVSIADTARGVRVRFEAPHLPRGLQVAFFAFGPDSELDRPTTRFAVHAIRWR